MLTPTEINRINEALARFKARIDDAKKAAGWGVSDWIFDAFALGGHPRQDIREAATGDRLYKILVSKRNEIIENPNPMHEEAIEIVTIATRATKWDRADAINGFRKATDVPGAIGDAAKKVMDETAKGLKWVPILIVILVATYVYQFLPRAARRK